MKELLLKAITAVNVSNSSASINSNTSWSLDNFLQSSAEQIQTWGGYIIVLIGVCMIIVAAWQIGSGLMSHGKKQTNWAVTVILLILGGAFAAGGWTFVANIASGGADTINALGSTILPVLFK